MNYSQLYNDLYNNNYHNDSICHTVHIINNDLKKYLPRGSKLLDVGCSTGNALSMMTELGYNPIGVDISSVAIDKCLSRGFFAKVGTADNIDLPNFSVDAITCTDVLEHVPEELIDRSILEFCRLVKNEGYIFLKIATRPEKNRRFDSITKKHGLDNLHITCYDQSRWLKIFKKWDLHVQSIMQDEQNGSIQVTLMNKIYSQKLFYFINRL